MKIKAIVKAIIGEVYYNFYYRYIKLKGNRVLIYHAFGSKLKHDSYGISIEPKLFEDHLIFLKDNYTLLPLCQDTFNNKLNINSVSITIDDGYKDNLIAVKLLEKYNIPYTIYISTGFIGKKQYLSKSDIKQISKSPLCTLGTHSIGHVHLSSIDKSKQYQELSESKQMLEDIIGEEVVDFSYPYGDYNDSAKEMADSLYSLISKSHIGINTLKNDKKMIKRIEVIASDTVNSLKRKVDGYYDFLKYK